MKTFHKTYSDVKLEFVAETGFKLQSIREQTKRNYAPAKKSYRKRKKKNFKQNIMKIIIIAFQISRIAFDLSFTNIHTI